MDLETPGNGLILWQAFGLAIILLVCYGAYRIYKAIVSKTK